MGLGCGEGLDSAPIGDACTVVDYCFGHHVVAVVVVVSMVMDIGGRVGITIIRVVHVVHVVIIIIHVIFVNINGVDVHVEQVDVEGRIGCEFRC